MRVRKLNIVFYSIIFLSLALPIFAVITQKIILLYIGLGGLAISGLIAFSGLPGWAIYNDREDKRS